MHNLFFFLLFSLSQLHASLTVATIEMFTNNVKIKPQNSIKKVKVTKGQLIKAGDLLTTSKNSSTKIKLKDGSILVLDERSTIHFHSMQDVEQVNGKVLYKITSRNARNSLKVKTPFSIIGIKGTTFIVNASSDASIILKEGLVHIVSIKAELQVYKKDIDTTLSRYKAEQKAEVQRLKQEISKEVAGYKSEKEKILQEHRAEIEAFKKSHNERGDEHMKAFRTKNFDLKAGNRISFNTKNIKKTSINKDDNAEFEYFDYLLKNMR